MRTLESQQEIEEAQGLFIRAVKDKATETIPVTVGFQSGNVDVDVNWLASLGIWAFFGDPPLEKSPGLRYWNVFGIGRPAGMVSIVCEINSPKRGLNRQAAGVFLRFPDGSTGIAHRGIFTANGRVPLEFTRRMFHWRWSPVSDGDRESNLMVIGAFGGPDFLQSLRDFVLEVARFKTSARRRPRA